MDIQTTGAADQRGHHERIVTTIRQHIDVASLAWLAPGIGAEEPGVTTEPFGSGARDGPANLGHDGRASRLGLPSLVRQLLLEVGPHRAPEGAYEVWIWQSRRHDANDTRSR